MSAPRYRIPAKVIALLHDRGVTCARLGEMAGLSERHVIRTLAGHPKVNRRARIKIIPHLTAGELTFLDWDYATTIHSGALIVSDLSSTVNKTISEPYPRLNHNPSPNV